MHFRRKKENSSNWEDFRISAAEACAEVTWVTVCKPDVQHANTRRMQYHNLDSDIADNLFWFQPSKHLSYQMRVFLTTSRCLTRWNVVSGGWGPIKVQLFSSTAHWKCFSREDVFSSWCDYPCRPKQQGEKLSYFLTGKMILMVLLTPIWQQQLKCYLRLRRIFDS